MTSLRLSRQQLRNCDIVAVEKYKIPSIILMENAGKAAADFAFDKLNSLNCGPVVIAAGVGNNAGDGFVVARALTSRGVDVTVFAAAQPERYSSDALTNLNICLNMNIPIAFLDHDLPETALFQFAKKLTTASLVIDALLGTGTAGAPREPIAEMINIIGRAGKPVLALDIPSGLDCDTGQPLSETVIKADWTITFAAEKIGFAEPTAHDYTGQVTVAGIGIKTELLIDE